MNTRMRQGLSPTVALLDEPEPEPGSSNRNGLCIRGRGGFGTAASRQLGFELRPAMPPSLGASDHSRSYWLASGGFFLVKRF